MFELIKAFVEVIVGAVPAIAQARKARRINDIGATLFMTYVRINEILAAAEEVVDSLEAYVRRMDHHLRQGHDSYAPRASMIKGPLEKQALNLARIARLMDEHEIRMILLTGSVYRRLDMLFNRKRGSITALRSAIDSNKFPIGLPEHELKRLLEDSTASEHPDLPDDFELLDEIERSFHEAAVPLDRRWDAEIYRYVLTYLEERQPRAQLAEIQQAAEDLRSALLTHFSLEDVLLRVGDKRFGGWNW